ncbi:hypothetical protein CEP82_009595 [Mobiluncus mulieris]|nr:hypothetical protein CEP82_009595 [Mobiluncus mulieris]
MKGNYRKAKTRRGKTRKPNQNRTTVRFVPFPSCDLYFRCHAVGMVYLQRAVDAVLARYSDWILVGIAYPIKTMTSSFLMKCFLDCRHSPHEPRMNCNNIGNKATATPNQN